MDSGGDDDGGDRSPYQSPSPSHSPPPPSSSRAAATSTPIAAPPHRVLTLALPAQHPRPGCTPIPTISSAGRDDCWSDGATSALIDAWGERFLELNRGSLRQKQWQEVADAVSSRDGYTKSPKTDLQCKNRIDTLKRKYKNESCKVYATAAGASSSSWPYFHRLDLLIGPTINPPPLLPTTTKPPAAARLHSSPNHRPPPHPSSSSYDGQSEESSDGFPPETGNGRNNRRVLSGMRELTQVVVRFGELYQRMEHSKMQHEMEMEKKRLAFTRELEEQRIQFFMKAQAKLSQVKPSHHNHRHHHHHQDGSSRKRKRALDGTSKNVNNNSYSSN